ncbi:MAG: HEAT repeat domain-containing protein [Candidatus Thorarchaeota archaeon]
MPSREWERFIENYYGDPYMMWHDGIDEKSVTRLVGEEREKAEDMLIQSLEEGSHYGAIGLRELRSEKAIPHLIEKRKASVGILAIEIAVALCLIKTTLEYVPDIILALKRSGFWSDRIRAAIVLRRFPTIEVVEALFESVAKDPDYLVRNHASETILFLHGMQPSISDHKEIFEHMIFEIDNEDESSIKDAFDHYQKCAQMLRQLIKTEGSLRKEPIIDDIWTWTV